MDAHYFSTLAKLNCIDEGSTTTTAMPLYEIPPATEIFIVPRLQVPSKISRQTDDIQNTPWRPR